MQRTANPWTSVRFRSRPPLPQIDAMMKARIYKTAKTAMQSGKAKTKNWILEFTPSLPPTRDPLLGWVSSKEAASQVQLFFKSLEAAITYCNSHSFPYTALPEPPEEILSPKNYSDNFCHTKRE